MILAAGEWLRFDGQNWVIHASAPGRALLSDVASLRTDRSFTDPRPRPPRRTVSAVRRAIRRPRAIGQRRPAAAWMGCNRPARRLFRRGLLPSQPNNIGKGLYVYGEFRCSRSAHFPRGGALAVCRRCAQLLERWTGRCADHASRPTGRPIPVSYSSAERVAGLTTG